MGLASAFLQIAGFPDAGVIVRNRRTLIRSLCGFGLICPARVLAHGGVPSAAGDDARTVGDDPAAAQSGEQRLLIIEADERGDAWAQADAEVIRAGTGDLAVELQASTPHPRLHLERELGCGGDDERLV